MYGGPIPPRPPKPPRPKPPGGISELTSSLLGQILPPSSSGLDSLSGTGQNITTQPSKSQLLPSTEPISFPPLPVESPKG